jgi:hypothetical protein
VDEAQLVEVILQRARKWPNDVEPPVLAQLHIEDAHLEQPSWLGAPDRDWTGEDVRPASEPLGAGVDFGQFCWHVQARLGNKLGGAGQHIDRDPITAIDR